MPPRPRRSERRTDALSRQRIVEAAVELLDAAGEGGLTFRALTQRLATGHGAIYWHVANKGELLDAATDAVVSAALATEPAGAPPEAVRAVALALFDVIDEHPWLAPQLAAQLAGRSWQQPIPRIVERIGAPVRALGGPEAGWFTATSALMHYILGAAGQNAANAASVRALAPGATRSGFLDAAARGWEALDPAEYPFTRAVADQVRDHDDRAQFLAGVDLILAGIGVVDAR